jgi:Caspase domain
MRIWLRALCAALALSPVNTNAQTIRTLFVGVDTYQYSANPDRKASFKDLKGAVGDSFRFKEAMRSLYKVEVDSLTPETLTAQKCAGDSANSITLVNYCAKREAILAALDTLISRSEPKDTVLFYFAGHGSQYPDDTDFEQASGYNGTILPTDAREPGAIAKGDILDKELKAIKDRATAAGIYFVTVFDSCNSGTATRDGASGQSRSVPMLGGKPPRRPTPRQQDGPGGGYWAHLAAAQDGEQAQEVGPVGQREGVFTTALIETMFAIPGGTFGDLIRETRIRVALGGHSSQTPMAEGTLTAALGSGAKRAVSFAAKLDGEMAIIAAGRLSGMTIGSEFAFYVNEADGFGSNPQPLATGNIMALDDFSATVKFNGAALTVGTNLVAIETRHAYGDLKLPIANMMKTAAETKLVQAALAALPFVGTDSKPVAQITSHPKKKGEALLRASDGTAIGDLGLVASPDFTDLLQGKLKKIQHNNCWNSARISTHTPTPSASASTIAFTPP